MPQTPREVVTRALEFANPDRIPRDFWWLPWATLRHPERVAEIRKRFPSDLASPPDVYGPSGRRQGDPYEVGTYVDEWGCVFTNIQAGVHGEIRDALLPRLADWRAVRPPEEILPADPRDSRDRVDRWCAATDRFVLAGACPRPWERYQFLRGSEDALMDLAEPSGELRGLLGLIHDFYMRELEFWVTTDVDAVRFMDDWGTQRRLLISPGTWREFFRPLYRDYCDLAHAHGKYVFMHSDGHILEIYPDLIEIGVDAINSQLFCMDWGELAACAKGRITFWGEMDRQHVVSAPDPEVGREAVRAVARHLMAPGGGIIAQLEFGPGGDPDTVTAIYEEWEKVPLSPRPPDPKRERAPR